jgi:hypothetical protein
MPLISLNPAIRRSDQGTSVMRHEETPMSKWLEGAEEAAFKKAVIAAALRRQNALSLSLLAIFLALGAGLAIWLSFSGAMYGPHSTVVMILFFAVVGLAAIVDVLIPHVYMMRTVAPILVTLPHTEQRITLSERMLMMPGKVLVRGAIGAAVMLISSLVFLTQVSGQSSFVVGTAFLLASVLLSVFYAAAALLRAYRRY